MRFSLPLGIFEIYTEVEIRKLQGGLKAGGDYFIAVTAGETITHVFHVKLRNQRQSQIQSSYPSGYEPFVVFGKEWNFDIHTSTFEVRCLTMEAVRPLRVRTSIVRRRAVILKTLPVGSEHAKLLEMVAKATELEVRLRRAAAASMERVEIVADLLRDAVLQDPTRHPSLAVHKNAADRFEFYVQRASPQTLDNILSVLLVRNDTPVIPPCAAA